MDELTAANSSAVTATVPDEALAAAVGEWLPAMRWFAGKGRTTTATRVLARTDLAGPRPGQGVVHLIIGVQLDGSDWQAYQVPLLAAGLRQPGLGALPEGCHEIGQ
jgi:hypothetical protein